MAKYEKKHEEAAIALVCYSWLSQAICTYSVSRCVSVKQRRGLLSSHVITFLTASRGEEGAHLRTWVSFWLKAFFYKCVCVGFPAVSASNGEQFTSGRFLSSDTFWCPWSHWNKCVLDGSGCVCACVRERVCSKWLMKTWSCSWNLITLLFLSLLTRFAGIKTHSRLNPPRNNKWNTHTLSHTHIVADRCIAGKDC